MHSEPALNILQVQVTVYIVYIESGIVSYVMHCLTWYHGIT